MSSTAKTLARSRWQALFKKWTIVRYWKQRALAYAAKQGHVYVLQSLVDHGALVGCETWTPLFYTAAKHGQIDTMQWVLDEIPSKYQVGKHVLGYVIDEGLGIAAQYGKVGAMEWLVSKGAKLSTPTFKSKRVISIPFERACRSGKMDAIEWIFNHCDPEIGLAYSLVYAAQYGRRRTRS